MSGVNYEVECQLCPDGAKEKYIGDSSRTLYARGVEHSDNYKNRSNKSFMKNHQDKKHESVAGVYTAKVTHTSPDCLSRQVREAVEIRRCRVPVLNSKTEWHQPPLYTIHTELYRG